MKRLIFLILLCSCLIWITYPAAVLAQDVPTTQHLVEPGDTWAILGWRYGIDGFALQQQSGHINLQREPSIGSTLTFAPNGMAGNGRFFRNNGQGLLQMAVTMNQSPWLLALFNQSLSPYYLLPHQGLYVPADDQPPHELPAGFESLQLSRVPALPGQAIAYRGQTTQPLTVTAFLDDRPMITAVNGRFQVGLTATGAFFEPGSYRLTIQLAGQPVWEQPWLFADDQWTFQQLTLTGSAAAIDQASIAAERARLFTLWERTTPTAYWDTAFQLPINSYLEISSYYGARRSYNGGPYRTYHEGVDFSAYGGTAVFAPAPGEIVVAEPMFVRGGTVIIDHGLGVFTGYYHLSQVDAEVGQFVEPGDKVGEVGTTGLSTGNHLHWDFLVNGIWVDAQAWLDQQFGCWFVTGLGHECQ